MKKRLISLVLMTALFFLLIPVTAFASSNDEAPVLYAWVKDSDERYFDKEVIRMTDEDELLVDFATDPQMDGIIIGWRSADLTEKGFSVSDGPVNVDGHDYMKVTAEGLENGVKGTVYYDVYRFEDVFNGGSWHWDTAVPMYSASVCIMVEKKEIVGMIGDADIDRKISVLDATAIQKTLASLKIAAFKPMLADTNRNGKIDILDATAIQRFLAHFEIQEYVGEDMFFGNYYAGWNLDESLLPDDNGMTAQEKRRAEAEVRQALSLLIDRSKLVKLLPGIDRMPASTFVSDWISDADGSQFYLNAGHSQTFTGYYDTASSAAVKNKEEAVRILKKYYSFDESSKKFTDIPVLCYIYNTGEVHDAIGQFIKSEFATVGITLETEEKSWDEYGEALAGRDYSFARDGWVVDYDDPMEFLEMFVSDHPDNPIAIGSGDMAQADIYDLDLTPYGYDIKVSGGTWEETYDVLIRTLKKCGDPAAAYAMMHLAEDMLMSTGGVIPMYYY